MFARLLLLPLLAAVAALVWVAGSAPTPRRGPADADAIAWDADSWFTLTRAYPSGRVPPTGTLERAIADRDRSGAARGQLQIPDEPWVSIGPSPIVVRNSLPWAGRVTAIAAHPNNSRAIYIGTDGGGIWRTADSGRSWRPLTPTLPVPAIASLAVDRRSPRHLYATTIPRTYALRLLRSTDGGASWIESAIVTDRGELSPVRCSVNVFKACIPPSSGRLFLDPQRSGSATATTLYFMASSHLFRSDDSGRSFRSILTLGTDLDFGGAEAPNLHPEVEFLRDATIDPARPNRLIAAVAQPRCLDTACTEATTVISVYRSFDAGEHWSKQEIGTLAPYPLVNTRYADPGAVYVPRVRLAIAPSNPDVIAIAFRDETLIRPRLYRSIDGGDTWAETAPPARALTWPLALAFSPADEHTIFVGSSGVHRTRDGGGTWQNLPATHVDNIDFDFTASGALIVGNDGGIFLETAGGSFAALHESPLPITEFYSIAAHPTNGLVLAGGTQDNGTVIYQGSLGWSLLTGGDGGDVVFDPDPASGIVYTEVEWFQLRGQNTFAFFRCQPNGCVERSRGIDETLDGPFIPRVVMDPRNSASLWLTAERLFRTDDRAENWTAASPRVGAAERCWQEPGAGRLCARARYFTAIAIAPSDSQTLYAGTLNGDVWMTTDRGASWRSIAGPDAGPLPVRAVNEIVVDPIDARTAFVAYSGFDANGTGRGHVFRTTDGGASWTDITGTLPDVPVNTLLIDPDSVTQSARTLYAGTDIGVFRVTLGGAFSWQPFGTGLPPVVVNRLAYNPATRQLLAATYGRGVWAISSQFRR